MSDIYVNHELKRDLNGNIEIDPSTGNLSIAETDFRKVGQLSPRYTMGWSTASATRASNSVRVLTARIGGLTYSATQGVLDYYGASRATADARDRGGIPINYGTVDPQKYYSAISTAEGGYGAYYLYSATNVRLQELSLQYTLPAPVVPQQSQTDGRIRRQEPLDDLLQGAVRPRNLGGDGQCLLSGRGLLHAAEHAQFRL